MFVSSKMMSVQSLNVTSFQHYGKYNCVTSFRSRAVKWTVKPSVQMQGWSPLSTAQCVQMCGRYSNLLWSLELKYSFYSLCEMSVNSYIAQFMKCVNFATGKHSKQRRKDPEATPYINHPIGKHICIHGFILTFIFTDSWALLATTQQLSGYCITIFMTLMWDISMGQCKGDVTPNC